MRLNSFTFTNCTVNKILHDSGTPQELNIMKLSRRDGAKLISSNFSVKTITIVGNVKGTSQDNLEANIDTLKQNIMVTNGNLDIAYAGLYRRYIVNCENITISREHNHITFAPFEIRFTVCDPPFGKEISAEGGNEVLTEACSVQNVTAQRDTSSFSIGGSVSPRPQINMIIDTAGNLGNINVKNTTTNRAMDIATVWENGNLVTVDTDSLSVQKNGTNIEFEGVFPTFDLGTNNFEINMTPTGALDQSQLISTFTYGGALVASTKKAAQSFKPSSSTNYNKIELFYTKEHSYIDPSAAIGDMIIRVETDTAGAPSGTLVHANATATIPGASLGASGIVTANFAAFALTSGTTYWIVVSSPTSDYTVSNYYEMKGSAANPYANGSAAYYSGGVWTVTTPTDLYFAIYKQLTPTWHVDYNVKYNKRYL